MQNAKNKKKSDSAIQRNHGFFTDLVIVYVHCICECL